MRRAEGTAMRRTEATALRQHAYNPHSHSPSPAMPSTTWSTLIWLPALLGAAMLIGCFVPSHRLPKRLPHDSVLHIGAFGLLALPIGFLPTSTLAMLALCGLLFVLGALVELAQRAWVPGRGFGYDDIAYNGIGVALGWFAGSVLAAVL